MTIAAILFLILALLVVLWHAESSVRRDIDARLRQGDGTADRSES